MRILILDDDPDDAYLLERVIREAAAPRNITIEAVQRPEEAERRLADRPFDLAFFDYRLGAETGLELLKRVAPEGRTPCPIILLTGQGNEQVAVEAMKAGALDYIIKDQIDADHVALAMRRAERHEEDRRRRRSAEAALERLRRQYELILTAAGEGIMGLDRSGRVVFANPAACDLVGYTDTKLEGQDAHRILHHAGPKGGACDQDPCPLDRAVHQGRFTESSDDRFWRGDGISIPVRFVVTPIVEAERRVGAVITFSDLTPLRQAEDARRLAAERFLEIEHLKELDTVRRGFLDTASAELDAPLVPLEEDLAVLRREEDRLTDGARKALSSAMSGVGRLRELTTDLRDVARIENHELFIRPERVEVAAVVGDVQRDRSSEADHARIALHVDVPANLVVQADRRRLQQALDRVVTNALRFTDPGGTVEVVARDLGEDVEIEVRDTGIGIDPGSLRRVFEPFVQAQNGREGMGVGLGLTIARGIVIAHGGDIRAESEGEGLGTTMFLTLPKRVPGYGEATAPAERQGERPSRRG